MGIASPFTAMGSPTFRVTGSEIERSGIADPN